MVASDWHGNSLVVQVKLTIRRGQSNFNIVHILVGWEENE